MSNSWVSHSRTAWVELFLWMQMWGYSRGKSKSWSVYTFSTMPKHHCCAYNCTNSVEKQKQPEKYREMANITFHTFPPDNPNKRYPPGMRERETGKSPHLSNNLQYVTYNLFYFSIYFSRSESWTLSVASYWLMSCQRQYIYLYIYFDVCMVLDLDNQLTGYVTRWMAHARTTWCFSIFSASLHFSD